MSVNQPDPKEAAARLLAYLRQLKNDRGAMADLRCALNSTKLPRAWPLLARVGGIDNLGTTCRRLAAENNSFDGRLRRLLSCDREEICERLRPVVLAAKAKGIPINYEELYTDLCYWGNNVKARWAREYWGVPEGEETTALALSEATP